MAHKESISSLSTTSSETPPSFPIAVHRMLTAVAQQGLDRIVSWNPNGRALKIHNTRQFETQVLPQFFQKQTRYRSFQRQLNFYGFARSSSEGSYDHYCFLRGHEQLAQRIQRIPKGLSSLKTMATTTTKRVPTIARRTFDTTAISGVKRRKGNSALASSFASSSSAFSPLPTMSARMVSSTAMSSCEPLALKAQQSQQDFADVFPLPPRGEFTLMMLDRTSGNCQHSVLTNMQHLDFPDDFFET